MARRGRTTTPTPSAAMLRTNERLVSIGPPRVRPSLRWRDYVGDLGSGASPPPVLPGSCSAALVSWRRPSDLHTLVRRPARPLFPPRIAWPLNPPPVLMPAL